MTTTLASQPDAAAPGPPAAGTAAPRPAGAGTAAPGPAEAGRAAPSAAAPDAAAGLEDAGTPAQAANPAEAAAEILAMRTRIDEIDNQLISLWRERAGLSQRVGATRVASGGTRLVLSREREILDRFREALGADGTQIGLLLLRAGRGPL
jgi:chorismate mutase